MKHFKKKSVQKMIKAGIFATALGGCVIAKGNIQDVHAEDYKLRLNSNNEWQYYGDDNQVDTDYTGLALNEYGWWYVENGVINTEYKGLAENDYGWWYVENGTINFSYKGLA